MTVNIRKTDSCITTLRETMLQGTIARLMPENDPNDDHVINKLVRANF